MFLAVGSSYFLHILAIDMPAYCGHNLALTGWSLFPRIRCEPGQLMFSASIRPVSAQFKNESYWRCLVKPTAIWLCTMFTLVSFAPAMGQSTASSRSTSGNANQPSTDSLSGSGTTHFVPLWLSTTKLGNSSIFQSGPRIGMGTKAPGAKLDVEAHDTNIPAIFALGATGAPGSEISGTDGIDAKGGDAAVDSGTASGGAGVVGTVGATSLFTTAGPGGVFTAGAGGGGDGIDASCSPTPCFAGNFGGDLNVTGAITAGTKDFKIDHPIDPANKYLVHASVESSEMKNIYDGTIVLDGNGQAVVELPNWFEALNGSFRYQLTAIGAPSPGLYIAQKIVGNRFTIAGGTPGVEVSWQVTGVRHDRFAEANPLIVEQAKGERERGYYIHPKLYEQPEEKGIEWARHPELMERMKERRTRAEAGQ
jgi:hypothetical protein